MLIELIGLPGSGKTTLVSNIIDDARFKSLSFISRQEIMQKVIIRNRAFTLRLCKADVRMWAIVKGIEELEKQLPATEERERWINRLLLVSYALVRFRKKNLLMDEGIVQYISSVLHECSVSDCEAVEKLLNIFQRKLKWEMILVLVADEELSFQRIRQRNRQNERFNAIKDDGELRKMIHHKKNNLQNLLKMVDNQKVVVCEWDKAQGELERCLLTHD